MAPRYQRYHLAWPLTATQLANLDDMLHDLFKQNSDILLVSNGGTGTSTAFTPGSIIFAGTDGVYTQDNSNLFWDDTLHRLTVRSRILVASTTPVILPSTATNSRLYVATLAGEQPPLFEREFSGGGVGAGFRLLYRPVSGSSAVNDGISIAFVGQDTAATISNYAAIDMVQKNVTPGSTEGALQFELLHAGSGPIPWLVLAAQTAGGIDAATLNASASKDLVLGVSAGDGLRITQAQNVQVSTGMLQFLGSTASFPALKRSSTAIQVRLADDSADAPLSASTVTASSLTSGTYVKASTGGLLASGPTPLAGTKTYWVSDTSGGAVNRKLTFTDGILTSET